MDWKELLKPFLEKLAEAIKGKSEEDKERILTEATDALPQQARQFVFDRGHSTAKVDAEAEAKRLTDEAAALKKQVTDKDAEIATLTKDKPDLEAIKTEHERRLAEKDKAHEEAIVALQGNLQQTQRQSFEEKLTAALIAKGVHPKAARIEVRDLVTSGRIKVDDKGEARVYKMDGATPFAAPTGQSIDEAFAEAHVENVDPIFRTSPVPGGTGERGGAGTAGDESHFKQLREEAKESVSTPPAEKAKELLGW